MFFFSMQFDCISSHDQQGVSDVAFVFFTMQSHYTPWPIGCGWQCIFFTMQSHDVSSHEQQVVRHFFSLPCSLICISSDDHWQQVSDHAFVFLTMQSHSISFYCDQQPVSDTESFSLPCHLIAFHPTVTKSMWVTLHLLFSLPCSIIVFHPMTNSQWVTVHLSLFAMESHWHAFYPTASEWQCICFSLLCSLIAFYPITNRMWVTVHFVSLLCSLIASYPMTNRMWATASVFLYCAVSLHFIPWPTGGEWQHICSSLPCSHAAFHPMTNSMWVTVHLFFFIMQSHCIPSHGQ